MQNFIHGFSWKLKSQGGKQTPDIINSEISNIYNMLKVKDYF